MDSILSFQNYQEAANHLRGKFDSIYRSESLAMNYYFLLGNLEIGYYSAPLGMFVLNDTARTWDASLFGKYRKVN